MELNILCGSSGVGKTTYIEKHKKEGAVVISPDNERRILGSVDNQNFSKQAFANCYDKLNNLPKNTKEVWFDATSLELNYFNSILKAVNPKLKVNINIFIFENSRNPEFCKSNIKKDISNKVDRSNTPDEVIDIMSKKYINLVDGNGFKIWVESHKANVIKI